MIRVDKTNMYTNRFTLNGILRNLRDFDTGVAPQ
jgi:hypothetical protein